MFWLIKKNSKFSLIYYLCYNLYYESLNQYICLFAKKISDTGRRAQTRGCPRLWTRLSAIVIACSLRTMTQKKTKKKTGGLTHTRHYRSTPPLLQNKFQRWSYHYQKTFTSLLPINNKHNSSRIMNKVWPPHVIVSSQFAFSADTLKYQHVVDKFLTIIYLFIYALNNKWGNFNDIEFLTIILTTKLKFVFYFFNDINLLIASKSLTLLQIRFKYQTRVPIKISFECADLLGTTYMAKLNPRFTRSSQIELDSTQIIFKIKKN